MPPLPESGTYNIFLDPLSSSTGTITLVLSEEIDAGAIAINGASVPVTINRVGQTAHLTFSGTQNQKLSLGVSGFFPSGDVTIKIYRPD
ncbi:MAG: putative Bacterial pre-peptidase C-terminal domain protein, partial [Deltaproteobacteria bacterium]|nr:putative Bacterial pre-peptidase C-terminal domain protein [Deltaproteobacteria bacterium]